MKKKSDGYNRRDMRDKDWPEVKINSKVMKILKTTNI